MNEIYFEGIVQAAIGEREGVARKPAPDMVKTALEELGKSADTAVYIGDSDVDVMTAKIPDCHVSRYSGDSVIRSF